MLNLHIGSYTTTFIVNKQFLIIRSYRKDTKNYKLKIIRDKLKVLFLKINDKSAQSQSVQEQSEESD